MNSRYALAASIFTAVLWNLARFGYALYTSMVLTYSRIYGSLGAVPILLLWIYIVWVIVLLGAALSATLQGRLEIRERDLEEETKRKKEIAAAEAAAVESANERP